jgi:alpha-tubulin suppressor-like RCC1 family protein
MNLPPVALGQTVDVVDVAVTFSCAMLTGGELRCWGENGNGQLGLGNILPIGDDELPVSVGVINLGATPNSFFSGRNHSCVTLDSGGLRCWGRNNAGQLGRGNVLNVGDDELPSALGNVPIGFQGLTPGSLPVAAAGGFEHTCVLFSSGELGCFGGNEFGQLGQGHVNNIGDDELLATTSVLELEPVSAVTLGFHHTCVVIDEEVLCWGRNERGQLGQGNAVQVGDDEPANAIGSFGFGLPITEVDAGGQFTCALLDEREVVCWGTGAEGQLGQGNTLNIGISELAADAPYVDLL